MKKTLKERFKNSIVQKGKLQEIKGGFEDFARCTQSCPGGTSVECSGDSCSTGDLWVQCDGNPKKYCPVSQPYV